MDRRKLAISPDAPGDDLFNGLTNAVPGFVWLTDDRGKVEFVNESWCDFTGLSSEESLGDGWLRAIHEDDVPEFRRVWRQARSEQLDSYELTTRCRRHDGAYRWHMVSVRRAPGIDGGHWIGCSVDIHEHVHSQNKDAFQLRILERVAAGAELDDILALLCEYAEAQLPASRCSIILVDPARGVFTKGVAPSLPQEMVSAIEGVAYGPGLGSCGTAAFEKRDVIVSDIANDPLWENRGGVALSHGMRACWSRPVLSTDGRVLATFAFYFPEIRSPTPDEMRRMEGITHIASMSIERGNILEALKESEEHYRHTVELNPQIPWTADAHGRFLTVSSKWAAETGLSVNEALNSGWLSVLHPDDVQPTLQHWDERLVSGEPVDVQYRIRLKNGTYRWMRARAAARRDRTGNILRWYGTLEDVHEHRLATDQLRKAAYEDELTKLPNRRSFETRLHEVLKAAAARGDAVGLVILDLDDFKQINDRFGHAAGDAVLRLFAHNLRKQARPEEFAARLGGDEFALIVPKVEGEDFIVRRAGMLTAAIDKQLKKNVKAKNSHASAGCAISVRGESAEELLKKADLALYDSKSAQRGAVRLFTPAIRAEHIGRTEQIELARKALQSGWIVPHYQPKVSLANGSIVGLEALIRRAPGVDGWNGPYLQQSAVPPDPSPPERTRFCSAAPGREPLGPASGRLPRARAPLSAARVGGAGSGFTSASSNAATLPRIVGRGCDKSLAGIPQCSAPAW
jgi:diguanylate cyclase (GGDEF)-like protein/PAS domain S-box-containing protein